MTTENYASRKIELLKEFDKSIGQVEQKIISRYGEEQAKILIEESHQEYEALIPQIPYIGEKNPLLIFLFPTTRYLAVYRTLQKHDGTLEDAGKLVYEMGEAALKAIPGFVRGAIGYFWFSPWFSKRLKRRATESQKRVYPGGYVLHFVEGDGRDFDYGIDYTECASCKFLSAQDALELCAVDKVASKMLGWGLRRTTTLAEAGERCDFRFKKGGKTRVTIPQSLKQIV